MSEHTPTRFKITWSDGRYFVSIPNYNGGEVVDAAIADALVKAMEEIQQLSRPGQTIGLTQAIDILTDIWNGTRQALAKVSSCPKK